MDPQCGSRTATTEPVGEKYITCRQAHITPEGYITCRKAHITPSEVRHTKHTLRVLIVLRKGRDQPLISVLFSDGMTPGREGRYRGKTGGKACIRGSGAQCPGGENIKRRGRGKSVTASGRQAYTRRG